MSEPCKHGLASGCADCGLDTAKLERQVREVFGVPQDVPLPPVLPQAQPQPPAYDFGALYEAADEGAAPAIEARFHGTCPLCGLRWEPGDEIARSADEDAWAHAGCAAAERE